MVNGESAVRSVSVGEEARVPVLLMPPLVDAFAIDGAAGEGPEVHAAPPGKPGAADTDFPVQGEPIGAVPGIFIPSSIRRIWRMRSSSVHRLRSRSEEPERGPTLESKAPGLAVRFGFAVKLPEGVCGRLEYGLAPIEPPREFGVLLPAVAPPLPAFPKGRSGCCERDGSHTLPCLMPRFFSWTGRPSPESFVPAPALSLEGNGLAYSVGLREERTSAMPTSADLPKAGARGQGRDSAIHWKGAGST